MVVQSPAGGKWIKVKVVFRADASVQIGTGHVMRCLTLADELIRRGHECCFVCRAHPGHLGDLIASKGYGLTLLPLVPVAAELRPVKGATDHYAQWLGANWQVDARDTLSSISGQKPDWLIVDHYALDARWERVVASAVGKIMVIDDLASRHHQCAVLLDQNVLDSSFTARYKPLVGKGCALLLGPQYALLCPEYGALARSLPKRDGAISRVLIFVGGSDPHQLTERYLNVLLETEFSHLFVDVVMGKNHPEPLMVEKLVDARPKTRLYSGLPSLAALMVRADLMLGAGGATTWERMCLGLNAIVTSVAENQDYVNQELLNEGLIHFLGRARDVSVEAISSSLKHLIDSPFANERRASKIREMVDGQGCRRVVDILTDQGEL